MEEFLAYTGLDLLNAFGGYLGLFIGASLLSLYDVTVNNFWNILTKFKSPEIMHETECNQEFSRWNNDIITKPEGKKQILNKLDL